jgi:hypothetical protein
VPDGRGRLLASGTNASLFSSNFLRRRDSNGELDIHERRLAMALEIDTASRVLSYADSPTSSDSGYHSAATTTPTTPAALARLWRDGQWEQQMQATCWVINHSFNLHSTDHTQHPQGKRSEGKPCQSFHLDMFWRLALMI